MNEIDRKTEMEKIVREFNALLNEEILENHKLREELRSERREKEYYKLMLAGKKMKVVNGGLYGRRG